jgi:AP-3 complex subunit delta-1
LITDEWKSKLPSLRATSQTFYSEDFVVEREGEMPDGTVAQLPNSFSHSTKYQAPNSSFIRDPSTSSFPSYQLPGQPSSSSSAAPEPIKVVRPKKKGKNKKQTVVAANAPSL